MKKRLLSSIMLATFLVTVSLPNTANAQINNTVDTKVSATISKTITIEEAIKVIESKYLIKNIDGTMSILDDAKNEIPSNILDDLKTGLENTNNNILQGNLIVGTEQNDFKITANNDNIIIIHSNSLAKSSNLLDNHAYQYSWFWWGFAAWVDSTGTQIMINDLEALRNILLIEGTAAGFLSCGVALSVSLVTAGGCEGLILQAKNALAETGSSILYCYGSPSASQVYKITSSW